MICFVYHGTNSIALLSLFLLSSFSLPSLLLSFLSPPHPPFSHQADAFRRQTLELEARLEETQDLCKKSNIETQSATEGFISIDQTQTLVEDKRVLQEKVEQLEKQAMTSGAELEKLNAVITGLEEELTSARDSLTDVEAKLESETKRASSTATSESADSALKIKKLKVAPTNP